MAMGKAEVLNECDVHNVLNMIKDGDFSRKYLDKTSNYMNILFYDNTKKPSIKALLGLHRKLIKEGNETFVGKIKKLVFSKMRKQYLPQ